MFLRTLKNRTGNISVQIISKASGKYKVVKTIGCGSTEQELEKLWYLGKQEIERLSAQSKIFVSEQDTVVEQVMRSLDNANISLSNWYLQFSSHLFCTCETFRGILIQFVQAFLFGSR
jgi:hypothetical protein